MNWNRMLRKGSTVVLMMGASMVSTASVAFAASEPVASLTPVYDSATDTYQVYNATQLEYIDMNQSVYLNANLDLMNNIDLSGYNWIPFGKDISSAYSGTFNGNGYGVLNVHVSEPAVLDVGFFGASSGTIENLHISGSMSGASLVGGLVGTLGGGSITNSYATGSVSGTYGSYYVGGLVGMQSAGSIIDSYATGAVSGTDFVGGLVGIHYGAIKDSYATGSVSGVGGLGGLVGWQMEGASIANSYATGVVSGTMDIRIRPAIGGLVGLENPTSSITDSYATGAVSGSLDIGGLVGWQGGSINHSYAAGTVKGLGDTGGLVGWHDSGSIAASFFDIDTTHQTQGVGYGSQTGIEGVLNLDMQSEQTFTTTKWDFNHDSTPFPANWPFMNIWGVHPNINNGYPYLQALENSYYSEPLSISPTVQPGMVMGSTVVTALPNTPGDILEYFLSTQKIAVPPLNSVVQGSLLKSNVVKNVKAGNYIGVYELNRATDRVVAFGQIGPLTRSDLYVVDAATPVILSQSTKKTVTAGQNATLSVSASVQDGGSLSYQWYHNTSDSNIGGIAIAGATNTTYTLPTTTTGTTYFYVVVTNTNTTVNGSTTASSITRAIPVTVVASSADALSSLTVSKGFLSPLFSGAVTSYTDLVGDSVTNIMLTPTVSDPTSSVTVSVYGNPVSPSGGSYNVPLRGRDNLIDVKVTAKDSTSQTYSVDVIRNSVPLKGHLPEVPWAGGLPLLGVAGAGAVWLTRRRKEKQS